MRMTGENMNDQPEKEESAVETHDLPGQRKKKTAVISVAAVFVCVLLVAVVWMWPKTTQQPDEMYNTNTNLSVVEELPKKLPRMIDGVSVERGKENFLPIAVMIENAAFGGVRPQSGLQEASVVYETLAEGGITRFMAVFASGEPINRIGPVRSARPYYVDWAKEYKGVYVHAGGSPQALQKIAGSSEFLDINQVAGDHAYFFRDAQAQSREHGLFTTTELIGLALRDNSLSEALGTFTPWTFQEKGLAKEDRPTDTRTIDIPFSTASYQVKYLYSPENNAYMRSHGTVAHTDAITGEQISVKNVVVQYTDVGILEQATGRMRITTVGSGDAIVFYNGAAHTATWSKASESARTIFTDIEGKEIEFIPGNIWIEVVPTDRTVEYTPNLE